MSIWATLSTLIPRVGEKGVSSCVTVSPFLAPHFYTFHIVFFFFFGLGTMAFCHKVKKAENGVNLCFSRDQSRMELKDLNITQLKLHRRQRYCLYLCVAHDLLRPRGLGKVEGEIIGGQNFC